MTPVDMEKMIAEHDRQIAEVWALFRETREQFQEARERQKKTDEQIARVSRQIGDMSNKWGEFVENLVAPGIKKVFSEWGIKRIYKNGLAVLDGEEMEIDIIAENSRYALAVEVKSTLQQNHVDEFLVKLSNFKRFFPNYAPKKLMGAVAGIVLPEQVSRYAYKQGLFVLGQSGETIAILNDADFRPKEW